LRLVSEEDHAILQERSLDKGKFLLAHVALNVAAANFSAQPDGKWQSL
jgi:hypothetical protein